MFDFNAGITPQEIIQSIDKTKPAHLETATFALG